ncbi:hypothetical protein AGMMS4957_21300 [Bacteroidia bacterium]|nr:hypothetical protein AGMMS4957_21300 [Bacteroidia bacterium]
MKNIFMVTIFLLFVSSSLANTSFDKMYSFDISQDITGYIDFYKDNTYSLTFYDSPSDMDEETTMSCGKYLVRDKKINLTDTIHGFKMQFRILSNNHIKSERGFVFMKNKDFQYRGNTDKYQARTILYSIANQKKERKLYKKHPLYPFLPCIYESENNTIDDKEHGYFATGLGYELDFGEDNKYRLLYKSILIAEGKWEKAGNEIALFDFHLQHSFYVLISNGRLISKYLPGEYRGLFLYKKNATSNLLKTASQLPSVN